MSSYKWHLEANILHKSSHKGQTWVNTYLNGEITKDGFQCLTNDKFGND